MRKLLPLLFALLAVGCEVLEEDISGKEVQITAPADRTTLVPGRVEFRWAAMQYASGYEFTVVAPSFATARRTVVDTVIYADSLSRSYGYSVELAAGKYEWRVRGFNGSYRTLMETRSLTVIPVSQEPQQPDDPEP